MQNAKVIPIQKKALAECQEKIDNLLKQSKGILDAAQAGDWELALLRQRERSDHLEAFYTAEEPMPQEVAELIASGIRQILEIDGQVTDLACAGKENLQKEAALKQKQGRAAKAYLQQG